MHIVCPHCHKTNRVPEAKLAGDPQCGACRQSLFSGMPAEFNLAQLQQHVKKSEIPVVVDFWAPWCGPCLQMAPAFAQAASDLEPNIRLAKVDTEADQQAGMVYGIRSIPTMILFAGGQEVTRVSGAMIAEQIKHWVQQNI
ncbi:MAG: thioredoxin TrxC [Thiolinea sp.]